MYTYILCFRTQTFCICVPIYCITYCKLQFIIFIELNRYRKKFVRMEIYGSKICNIIR